MSQFRKVPELNKLRLKLFSPSDRLCNFAPRQVAPVYCQWRPWKGTAAQDPRRCSFVGSRDSRAAVQLHAVGRRHAAAALNGWTHVGCGFQGLPDRHRKMPHAVDSVLNLPWWWDCRRKGRLCQGLSTASQLDVFYSHPEEVSDGQVLNKHVHTCACTHIRETPPMKVSHSVCQQHYA